MASLYEQLRADIVVSMKARNQVTTTALRSADAAIKKVSIDGGKDIDDAMVLQVIRKSVKNLQDAIVDFEKAGRNDLIDANKAEIAVLQKYLPAALDGAKLESLIAEAMQETGVTSKKEMGKVIGALKKRPEAGQIDFAAVSKLLQTKLV